MGGVQRNFQRVGRYARKGRTVGGVNPMTAEERSAHLSSVVRDVHHEAERLERIEFLKSQRTSRKAS